MLKFIFPMMALSLLTKNNWIYIILTLSMLLLCSFNWLSFNFINSNFIMADNISMSLLNLSLWIGILMILSSYKIKNSKMSEILFMNMIMILITCLYMCFSTSNFLLFYILFETSLIPTALLILGWGYQPERWQAFIYLMFYTLVASLPLLISLFWYFLP